MTNALVVVCDVSATAVKFVDQAVDAGKHLHVIIAERDLENAQLFWGKTLDRFPETFFLSVVVEFEAIEPVIHDIVSLIPGAFAVVMVNERHLLGCVNVFSKQFIKFKKLVLVLIKPSSMTNDLQSLAIKALEDSALNYCIVNVSTIMLGPSTGNLICDSSFKSDERSVTHQDLSNLIFHSIFPLLGTTNISPWMKTCKMPRMNMYCYTYGTPAEYAHIEYKSKLHRQPHKYSGAVLKHPLSRWGTIKFNQSKPGYLRTSQRLLPVLTYEPGNLQVDHLRMVNHWSNKF